MESKSPISWTQEELTERFIQQLREIAEYWATEERVASRKDACDGVVFTILSMLDGCSVGMPAFSISVQPHPDDKKTCIDAGVNYYEPGMVLSPWLHERYYRGEGQK